MKCASRNGQGEYRDDTSQLSAPILRPHPCRGHSRSRRETDGGNQSLMSINLPPMRAILLLIISNVFMTFAWYGHLKWFPGSKETEPLWKIILISWGIA